MWSVLLSRIYYKPFDVAKALQQPRDFIKLVHNCIAMYLQLILNGDVSEAQDVNSSNETTVECPRDLSVDDIGNGMTTTLIPISSGQPGETGPQV